MEQSCGSGQRGPVRIRTKRTSGDPDKENRCGSWQRGPVRIRTKRTNADPDKENLCGSWQRGPVRIRTKRIGVDPDKENRCGSGQREPARNRTKRTAADPDKEDRCGSGLDIKADPGLTFYNICRPKRFEKLEHEFLGNTFLVNWLEFLLQEFWKRRVSREKYGVLSNRCSWCCFRHK